MTTDISRKSFDARRYTAWTTTMQGRVATDAPVNEDRTLRDRRLRAAVVDLGGRCGYPELLPDSFKIGLSAGELTIDPGRYYVDGHLAENFGADGPVFDDVLSELRGPDAILFSNQPFGTEGVLPPADAGHLVYLDVWQRDVTYLEDDTILDPGIATDSFARRQTVWQVRYFGPVGAGVDCATDAEDINGWLDLIAPSAARLTTRANPASAVTDPCLLPPGAQYRGIDNRTYRVEIHGFSATGAPLVKFSRTNGTVATAILSQPQADILEVAQVAKDDFLRFNPGDWAEITDEQRLLAGQSGTMARVLSVDDPSNTITLENPLPAGALVLVGVGPDADQARHPVLRRWDQAGQVRDENGVLLVDLDLAGADGLIPAPTDGTFIALEDGVEAALTLVGGGDAHVNDNWTFIARFADSSVEELTGAPPQDYQHHYCRLAMATALGGVFTAITDDCRDPLGNHGDCCCTITVTPGDNIQAAIDDIPVDIGGCICLTSGTHVIDDTLILRTSNVRIVGESRGAIIVLRRGSTVLRAEGVENLDIDMVGFRTVGVEQGAGQVEMLRCQSVNVERCSFAALKGTAAFGVVMMSSEDVAIRNCEFRQLDSGVLIGEQTRFTSMTDNVISLTGKQGDGASGILAAGAAGPVTATANHISGVLNGIMINDDLSGIKRQSLANRSLVADNIIELLFRAQDDEAVSMYGIDIAADECTVRGNHVRFAGNGRAGIRVTGYGHAIVENQVEADLNADDNGLTIGILIGGDGRDSSHHTEQVVVANNQVRDVSLAVMANQASAVSINDNDLNPFPNRDVPAISLTDMVAAEVRNNAIPRSRFGIVSTRGLGTTIAGNAIGPCVYGIALKTDFGATVDGNIIAQTGFFGIFLQQCLSRTSVTNNRIANAGASSPLAIGIGALLLIGEWHVAGNEVINTGLPVAGDAPAGIAVGIFGFLVMETLITENHVGYLQLQRLPDGREDRAMLLQGLLEIFIPFGELGIRLGFPCQILDNKFRGKGLGALVELRQTELTDNIILRFERVFFSNNFCDYFGPMRNGGAVVVLDGHGGVVMGNQVKALIPNGPSMNLGNMLGAVAANLTSGAVINHPNFPAPEASFNRII